MKTSPLLFFFVIFLASCSFTEPRTAQLEWIPLFNGRDLDDWTIKISKHELNDNFANTFRVDSGLLKVSYAGYDGFDQQFGHIFYNKPFSAYFLRVEYRFVGEQVEGGPGWAYRNSGVMLHGQDPKTMLRDQDFPISVEAQLLGGDGEHERSTGNVCTPGTNIEIDGKLFTTHCLDSKSKTYHGDQWVRAEFLVLGDSIVHHIIEGDTVLSYRKPQIGGGNVDAYDPAVKIDGKALTAGYISLQSESHPVEFRKVDLIDLAPYQHDKNQLDKILMQIREQQ